MNEGLTVLSCTLAAAAGVCFVSGLVILKGGRVKKHGQTGDPIIHVRRVIGHC